MSEKIRAVAEKLYRIGFAHIFTTSVINKLLSLITNMVIVRVLSKSDYGMYSYAYNIVTIVLIVSDLGTRMARFQYCCETNDPAERKAITRFLMSIGTVSNIVFSVGTFLYATFLPLSIPGGKFALQMLSATYLFQYYYDQTCYGFRIEKDNKRYAFLTNINSIGYGVSVCVGAWLFGIAGMVSGKYISFVLPVVIGLCLMKKQTDGNAGHTATLSAIKKREMVKYGLLIVLTNSVSSVLSYFDTYLVGRIITDELVLADYKVATVIPHALNFIPLCCMTMIYPYFVEHKDDKKWIIQNTHKIQLLLGAVGSVISAGGFLLAPYIIKFVFGEQYLTAVPVFRILIATFFIACTFRIPTGNILSMMHLVKVNFWLSVGECVINIAADVLLIHKYGSIGAAYATFIITVLSSLFSGIYFHLFLNKQKKSRGE